MLACSMLAQAWQFADDTVQERPAPADLGGYVLPVLKPFHKVFVAAGGNYVEYDTCGDQVAAAGPYRFQTVVLCDLCALARDNGSMQSFCGRGADPV